MRRIFYAQKAPGIPRGLHNTFKGGVDVWIDVTALLIAASVPSAVTAFCFWNIQRNITKRDKQRDELEKARERNQVLLIKSIGASLALGEATAEALMTGKTNGEMKAALEYARKVKREQKDFLTEQGIKNLY